METKKPTKLAIGGKVISIEKIGEKSLVQWKNQLRLANINVDEATAERLWLNLRGELTDEQKAAKAEVEAKAAEMKAAAEEKFESLKKGK